MDIQIILEKKHLITWISKNYWEMFHSEIRKSRVIITCPRKIVCNYCDKNIGPGDKLYDG